MLVIKTLGGLTIELEGERKRFTARADEALLIYIISHAHPLPRTTLVELLWQNSNPKQANHNFRAALSRLRRVVGDYLMVTRQMIGFDHSRPYYLDADHLEAVLRSLEMPADGRVAAAAAARLATAVALYQGDFLAGFSVKGSSPEFDSWLLLVQERLHALAVSGLQQLTRHALQSGQWTNGIQFATQFVRIDPLNELAHQQKMRLHLRNRDRSAALRQYKICRQILADELGVDPLTSTRQLAERLRAATPHAHNLPVDPSPLIGRSAEIRTLVTNLFTPGTRLVTLTGIGGIGKRASPWRRRGSWTAVYTTALHTFR